MGDSGFGDFCIYCMFHILRRDMGYTQNELDL